MPIIDKLSDLFERNSQKFMYVPIEFSHVKDAKYHQEPLEGGKNYFRLWLNEMYLAKDREWFDSWYPVVHSVVHFQFGTEDISLTHVAGPLNLKDVNPSNLENVINLNYPLTPLMPFNGGVVEVSAGLLAMEGEDNINKFIKVMGDFSNILIVPQLSAALYIAEPIAKGVEQLVDASNGTMHLGLHQAYVGNEANCVNVLKAGYTAVILAQDGELEADKLWVANDKLYYGTSIDNNEPLEGFTYMLFRIDSQEQRDDVDGLTDINKPRREAINALMNGEEERAKTLLKTAIAAAMMSLDLTKADRLRVVQDIKNEFDEARKVMNPIPA